MEHDDDSESELLGPVQESHQSLTEGANSESNDPVDLWRLQVTWVVLKTDKELEVEY